MADRSSARAFGLVFKYLAEEPIADRERKLARKLMKATADFDFSPDQMECDSALLALNVAKRGAHPDDPDGSVCTLYLDADGGWS